MLYLVLLDAPVRTSTNTWGLTVAWLFNRWEKLGASKWGLGPAWRYDPSTSDRLPLWSPDPVLFTILFKALLSLPDLHATIPSPATTSTFAADRADTRATIPTRRGSISEPQTNCVNFFEKYSTKLGRAGVFLKRGSGRRLQSSQ